MREKHRYVLVKSSETIKALLGSEYTKDPGKAFSKLMNRYLLFELGDVHYSDANPQVAAILDDKTFILKVLLNGFRDSVIGLAFINKVNNIPVSFTTLKSSGTIKSIKTYYKSKL
ncbi:ribonuclease P protein subunit aPop5 [Candidatus Mancarchaeum acidiphilum]|uniref:Ribonuclease P protein subunit aPop5 n=1 Tax=Candidatus Mancarchaeum acidiphilum TaxID=1920749 RepID=A0A218NLP1_9ARCH|nr:Rpp14/Pop5 family protein [Candidatus Mancarchaeum acidiphilum]ASI13390.1 ribonuclease P protein subunit aPop5 [Candidatus Mancarchaeum acidiphilum]